MNWQNSDTAVFLHPGVTQVVRKSGDKSYPILTCSQYLIEVCCTKHYTGYAVFEISTFCQIYFHHGPVVQHSGSESHHQSWPCAHTVQVERSTTPSTHHPNLPLNQNIKRYYNNYAGVCVVVNIKRMHETKPE